MSNPNLTTDTEQFIANKEHNPSYKVKDVMPWVETTQGSVAAKVTGTATGSKVAMDVNISATGGTAATLIADNESLPTTTRVGAVMQGKDAAGGTDIDVARLAKAHDVDSGANTEYATGVTLRVAASGASIAQTYAAGNSDPGTQRVVVATDQAAIPASQSGTWTVQPGNTPNTSPWLFSPYPPTISAGVAPSNYKNAGAATKANIKASAGNVLSLRFTNANAAVRFLQLHNKATAPAGTDTAQRSFLVPAGTTTQPAVLELDINYFAFAANFTTGIGWAVSTTDTTFTDSATASDHTIDLNYV